MALRVGSADGAGVLPSQRLTDLIDEGVIDAGDFKIPRENIQPASLDLRLGEVAYRIRCSFLPDSDTVEGRLKPLIIDELDLRREGAVLESSRPYLIPLKERLALPAEIRGKANPKSSTGRADVFTRVITDGSYRFDEIAPGYRGQLYLEVVPLSFPVRVWENLSLNQLRLSTGPTSLSDEDVRQFHAEEPILFSEGRAVSPRDLALAGGLFLGLDLRGDETGRVGYRARNSAPLLDMTQVRATDPWPFWEPVIREDGDRVVLNPKSGELRTHYAGFFDPGFGYDPDGRFRGSTAALEVRAHDVPFMIEHRQRVCKLTFERMLEAPTQLYGQGIGSNYQQQTETLGKHFRLPHITEPGPSVAPRGPVSKNLGDQLELLGPEVE